MLPGYSCKTPAARGYPSATKGTTMVKAYDASFTTEAAAQEWANRRNRWGWFTSQPWWNELQRQWFVTYSPR